MARGATAVRGTDLKVANFFLRTLNAMPPGFRAAAGGIMEVVSQAGRLGSGILDLSMGLFGLQQITGRRFGIGPKMFAGTQAGFARTQVSWLKMFAQANAGLTALYRCGCEPLSPRAAWEHREQGCAPAHRCRRGRGWAALSDHSRLRHTAPQGWLASRHTRGQRRGLPVVRARLAPPA